jgi:1-acyl-sn-glycerol-3-phosphate acyltransferase
VKHLAKGVVSLLGMGLNTLILAPVLLLCSIAKFLSPTDAVLRRVRALLAKLPVVWISINNGIFALLQITRWDIDVAEDVNTKGCYLVVSNHQSWADIIILQRCFNRRLPFFRFFVKSSMIWFPFLGAAWWALDMPFMKRYSREKLEQHPELRGKDLESAREACEKFRGIPLALMNFPEGTRFSKSKRNAQGSPYQNLLEPRIGGIGQVLYALADQLDSLIDVTIVFPGWKGAKAPTFWQFVSGQVPKVLVRARQVPVPARLRGRNFRTDPKIRMELADWVGQLWREKDGMIPLLDETNRG